MAIQVTKRTYVFVALAVFLITVFSWHISTSADSRGYVKDLLHISNPSYVLDSQQYERPPSSPLEDLKAQPAAESPSHHRHHIWTAKPVATAVAIPAVEESTGYGSKLYFENDLPYKFPELDLANLKTMSPHNYKGSGHPTFATMFLSRSSSLQDPYFIATHEVVYRLLWNPDTKTADHPVTIFVAPFVAQEQRSYFEAIGAIVREVQEMPFQPDVHNGKSISHRFRDVFSKLEMWSQTDFSRIVYLDSDAFPLVNIDALMSNELAPESSCRRELLWTIDQTYAEQSCQYTFTGVQDLGVSSMINAGVMVLQPNKAMYELLLREFHDPDNTGLLNSGFPEQGLLSHVFRQDGPFPATVIDNPWNGDPGVKDSGGRLNILHAKLWALRHEGLHWTDGMFAKTWEDLNTLYASQEFAKMRAQDSVLFKKYFATNGRAR